MIEIPSYRKLPPFYVTRTLMGFGPGPDLNRVFLNMPGDQKVVLRDMSAPRTDEEAQAWNELAAELSKVWERFDERFK